MPCYQVNTVSVEFKAKNRELIMETLRRMEMNPYLQPNGRMIKTPIGVFDLDTGKVETASWNVSKVNEFRVEYSKTVLKKAAKKHKWIVKSKKKNQYQVKKW